MAENQYRIVKLVYTPQEFAEVKQRAALNGFAQLGQQKEGGGESTAGVGQYLKWCEAQTALTKKARGELIRHGVKPLSDLVNTLEGLSQDEYDLVTSQLSRRRA